MSFHHTEFKDEFYPQLTWKAGDVLRDPVHYAFCDFVVLGFSDDTRIENPKLVKVARCYAYVSGAGTTDPTVLLGAETMTATIHWLRRMSKVSEGRCT